jgi:phosphatidylethanolamine N-methyltransferase
MITQLTDTSPAIFDAYSASDQKLLLATFYATAICVLPSILTTPRSLLIAHFFHALVWRVYYSLILGWILKAQSDEKWLVQHYLTRYHYPSNDHREGAVKEAFENWKQMYNLGQIMCYRKSLSFSVIF